MLATLQSGTGGCRLVLRVEQGGTFRRRLQGLGHHQRDRLVGVTHLVILQHFDAEAERRHLLIGIMCERRPVGRRQHLDHPGMRLGRRDIK